MRLGWDIQSPNALEIALLCQDLGVSLISVHARFRNQFFKGTPDWSLVRPICEETKIPVIINGDISDIKSAKKAIELSKASGIMVGRAAIGYPWLISLISSNLYDSRNFYEPYGYDFINLVKKHFMYMISFYGKEKGLILARKHLSMYLKRINLSDTLIKKVLLSFNYINVINLLDTEIKESYLKSLNL